MPWMPAISRIVVLPNHIRKFIRLIRMRTEIFRPRKLTLFSTMPWASRIWFTGPTVEKSVKNSIEKAAAMMRLGM